ncbi:hypothetical protein CEXT_779311 [Caerostris extrusa]|uniref:Uncharacterized protein n=1 Tax=Caerostris extrusa TaxID=172846 RepID=A0AAV4WZW5_CAEEX|nr:hypothetical protein CEXT_779311 [Caerostris extrusa]
MSSQIMDIVVQDMVLSTVTDSGPVRVDIASNCQPIIPLHQHNFRICQSTPLRTFFLPSESLTFSYPAAMLFESCIHQLLSMANVL